MSVAAHWEQVYRTKEATALSWYQAMPAQSLRLIAEVGATSPRPAILDVGGGDSLLVDHLLELDAGPVTVLDLSAAALARARARLGGRGEQVTWIAADVTRADLPAASYDIWHDRAVLHFLTTDDDRRRYVAAAARALRAGGTAIVATFALDGPARCSGLEVIRYSTETLAETFGPAFTLVRGLGDVHVTPAGTEQRFTYAVLRRRGGVTSE